jgi:hypothetical protein
LVATFRPTPGGQFTLTNNSFFFSCFLCWKERNQQKKKSHGTVPLRKMLAPGKEPGTSVTRWLPYRDGNRLTKVVLGDVEVVLAKYYPPLTCYFIFFLLFHLISLFHF